VITLDTTKIMPTQTIMKITWSSQPFHYYINPFVNIKLLQTTLDYWSIQTIKAGAVTRLVNTVTAGINSQLPSA